jgi:hypothetical protein
LPTSRSSAAIRVVLGQHVGSGRVAVERASLVLGDPDADQVAAKVALLGKAVEGLAGQAAELHRLAAVLGHMGFSSKARSE